MWDRKARKGWRWLPLLRPGWRRPWQSTVFAVRAHLSSSLAKMQGNFFCCLTEEPDRFSQTWESLSQLGLQRFLTLQQFCNLSLAVYQNNCLCISTVYGFGVPASGEQLLTVFPNPHFKRHFVLWPWLSKIFKKKSLLLLFLSFLLVVITARANFLLHILELKTETYYLSLQHLCLLLSWCISQVN